MKNLTHKVPPLFSNESRPCIFIKKSIDFVCHVEIYVDQFLVFRIISESIFNFFCKMENPLVPSLRI
jgi:hypothetical protein